VGSDYIPFSPKMEDIMSGKITWKIGLFYIGAVLFGIVIGTFAANLAGRLWIDHGQVEVAQAAESAQAVVESSDGTTATYICTPAYIGAFSNRVHVLCTIPAPGGIVYFAAPTSDSKNANRVLSIMLTAKSLGKTLQIYYDSNGDGSAFGCGINNCRPINAIEITN
jgi:hypothetical protein